MTSLGIDRDSLRDLGEDWADGGLWDDVLWLALRFWDATDEVARRRRWHHLVMAVGNFKRQRGRRLQPSPISPADGLTSSPRFLEFQPPGTAGRVGRDDPASWTNLDLPGAATATHTSLLAALWPDHHHVLDWRVLA